MFKFSNKGSSDVTWGILYILLSLGYLIILLKYNSDITTLFSASSKEIYSIFEWIYYISDVTFQMFGLFSYVILFVLFIRGIILLCKEIEKSKYEKLWIIIFIISGLIIINILSTYPSFQKTIEHLNYYAGGALGYILSKIIFIDIFHRTTISWYIITILILIWAFSFQYITLIKFSLIFQKIKLEKILELYRSKQYSAKSTLVNQDEEYASYNKEIQKKVIREQTKQEQAVQELPISSKLTNKLRVNNSSNAERFRYTKQYSNKEDTQIDKANNNSELLLNNIPKNIKNNSNGFLLPDAELLNKNDQINDYIDNKILQEESENLLKVLKEFSVKGEIININQGPVVTTFDFRPAAGIKTSRIISLSDDVARAMGTLSVRIANIPGKNAIGIELSNKNRQIVYLSDLIISKEFQTKDYGIQLILGKDISGNPILADLTKMPHLLVAGTTGSGKSVSINDMILSILFKFPPNQCKFIMIDPKMLELSVYDNIPHLLTPVVTDPKKAVFALQWAVSEMEVRYKNMAKMGVRNIEGFNKKLDESKNNPKVMIRRIQTGFNPETGKPIIETQKLDFDKMPYIVIVVDEIADLMLTAGKEVELAIQRLAQMARAAGIHLIMATQRPSVDVITGTIKANFPTRISFQVSSKIDSRTILGEHGAEQLLGQGDMLYMSGAGRVIRIHAPFVSDEEVDRVVNFLREQGFPEYNETISANFKESSQENILSDNDSSEDDLYQEALNIVKEERKCSINYLQRRLQIGYNRTAKIIELLEKNGILSPPNKKGRREILI